MRKYFTPGYHLTDGDDLNRAIYDNNVVHLSGSVISVPAYATVVNIEVDTDATITLPQGEDGDSLLLRISSHNLGLITFDLARFKPSALVDTSYNAFSAGIAILLLTYVASSGKWNTVGFQFTGD